MTDTAIVRSDPPGAHWVDDRVVTLVRSLIQAFSHIRTLYTDLGPGAHEFVFTEDLTTTVRALDRQIVQDVPWPTSSTTASRRSRGQEPSKARMRRRVLPKPASRSRT